jgi:hypothetical protein
VFEEMGLRPKTDAKREIFQHENERFFIPVDTHIEIHTCVGVICAVLQNLYTVLCTSCLLLVGVYLLRQKKRENKRQKKA